MVVPSPTIRSIVSPEETPFYIPARGQTSRPRRTLKANDTFAVVDTHGDIGASQGDPDGIFNNDTRYLSQLELKVSELEPLLLGSNIRNDNAVLTVDLTNPDIYVKDRLVLPKDSVHIVRTCFVWQEFLYTRFSIRNHCNHRAVVALSLSFANDFADIFEVRGMRRARRGAYRPPVLYEQSVSFFYEGLDNIERSSSLYFDPKPDRLSDHHAVYNITLAPRSIPLNLDK